MNIREPIVAADIEETQAKAKQYAQCFASPGIRSVAYKAYYDGYTAAWLAARKEAESWRA
jgi:hypothetical protein